MFENPRRDRQARNFTTNVPKILDLKSSSEQTFSENWRWVPLSYSKIYAQNGENPTNGSVMDGNRRTPSVQLKSEDD